MSKQNQPTANEGPMALNTAHPPVSGVDDVRVVDASGESRFIEKLGGERGISGEMWKQTFDGNDPRKATRPKETTKMD